MDSALKIGDGRCLTAASRAVVPSFWLLETGVHQTKAMWSCNAFLGRKAKIHPSRVLHALHFYLLISRACRTDSQTPAETFSSHGQQLLQRTGIANRHQWRNLIKLPIRVSKLWTQPGAPIPFLVSIQDGSAPQHTGIWNTQALHL